MKKNGGRKHRRDLANSNKHEASKAKQKLDANRHKPYNEEKAGEA